MRILPLLLLTALVSCTRVSTQIEPTVVEPPHPKEIHRENRSLIVLPENFSRSPFPPLSPAERATDWGKELTIAFAFAQDFDLYRAITGFKRARALMPPTAEKRRLEVDYDITLAYYLGKKYTEAVYTVESTDLIAVGNDFPAFDDLLLILYDAYCKLGRCNQAAHILDIIEKQMPASARKIHFLKMVEQGDLHCLRQEQENRPYLTSMLDGYQREAKSPKKARLLNAAVPGAGYWYVGQKQTAVTALLVNAVFIGIAGHFINHGNMGAAIFTLSLESGWYFGGITGAGLAAKEYNERLYESYTAKITAREQFHPKFMLKYTF